MRGMLNGVSRFVRGDADCRHRVAGKHRLRQRKLEHVREEMEFIFAENIDDVLSAAIPGLAEHPSLMLV